VPIGPTFELRASGALAEVTFVADHFRVRRGHRLVLAVEVALACAEPSGCRSWQLLPASYRQGRCWAEALDPTLRMQFGSVPTP
jgi:hypothetical protein